ncbi:hypothetical protein PENTCL1PPCAC_28851, partial [Pristionchus entomophagus]
MLQQPVAPELRSFQSLSKYSGPRAVVARRQSQIIARRSSQCRKRTETDDEAMEAGTYQQGSREPEAVIIPPPTASPKTSIADQSSIRDGGGGSRQVEWGDDEFEEEEFDPNLPYPGFIEPSLFIFKQAKVPRSWCLQAVMSPWFDRVTMGVILINCITLGMFRPCEDGADCKTYRCQMLQLADHVIFAYFAFEMCVKVIAMGFTGAAGYLSDTWNRLDFFIVIAGCAEYVLQEYVGNINLTAIRTIRVLRPLRAVNRIPSMRILGEQFN